jgi:hypothetical protein
MALSVRLRLCRPATRPSYGWRLCTDGLSRFHCFGRRRNCFPPFDTFARPHQRSTGSILLPSRRGLWATLRKPWDFRTRIRLFFFFAENRLVAMNIWASAHRADVAATLCPCGLYVHRLTDESIGPRSGAAAAAWSISLLVN